MAESDTNKKVELFTGIHIAQNWSKTETMRHLKRFCAIDDLDDTIYIKKLGNDKATFSITFGLDGISTVKKIKDSLGNNIDETVFECAWDDDDEHDKDLHPPLTDDEQKVSADEVYGR